MAEFWLPGAVAMGALEDALHAGDVPVLRPLSRVLSAEDLGAFLTRMAGRPDVPCAALAHIVNDRLLGPSALSHSDRVGALLAAARGGRSDWWRSSCRMREKSSCAGGFRTTPLS